MKRMLLVLSVALPILSGCAAPRTVTVEETVEVYATVVVTVAVEVPCTCPTLPASPTAVICPDCPPCPTAVPAPNFTPGPIEVPSYSPKSSGYYRVGLDMAPGVWRSSGTVPEGLSGCALAIKSLGGELEALSDDPPGSTIRIPQGDHQVIIQGCTWVFIRE